MLSEKQRRLVERYAEVEAELGRDPAAAAELERALVESNAVLERVVAAEARHLMRRLQGDRRA